jgi:hypothetical protein
MAKEAAEGAGLGHGASLLPEVEVLSYNVELKDDEGFVGDRASKGAFWQSLENWRKPLRDIGEDPFGEVPSSKLARKKLDALLAKGEPESVGVIQGAIESFAQEFAGVIARFLKLRHWKDTDRIVVGSGFCGSCVGELAIGRGSLILKAEKIKTEISIIRNDPDEAALIGAVHLAPTWMFKVITRSWPSISAAPTSGPASSASICMSQPISQKPRCGNMSSGGTAMKS